MRRPSPMRGGDEGDLLKQILMLEVFDWIAPAQGEFWFLESHAGVGRRVADMPALDWFASAAGDHSGKWDSFPLWARQKEWLSSAEFLDSSGLAYQRLSDWMQRGISVRWLFCHESIQNASQFQQDWLQWVDEEFGYQKSIFSQNRRLYQLFGVGVEAIQEMVYLGTARAPGFAVIEPPGLVNQTAPLLTLIETLLIRRFWVLVKIPLPAEGKQARDTSLFGPSYAAFSEGVQRLEIPGIKYEIEGRQLSWKPKAKHEFWLLAPSGDLRPLQQNIWERLFLLFGEALGRAQKDQKIQGLKSALLSFQQHGLGSFEDSLPLRMAQHLELERAKERDLSDIIYLWEKLMDEHATFDEHFQRRPLARLYLRHSFTSQQNQPDYLLLIVRHRRKAVGFLSAQILHAPLFQESRIGQIVDVFVESEWRNQGIGEKLVEVVELWFRSMGVEQIDLNVAVHNLRGKKFWERKGFRPYLNVVSKELN